MSLGVNEEDSGVGRFLQAQWTFVSVVPLGPGGDGRLGLGLCDRFGAGERSAEELLRGWRGVAEEAGIDGWGGGEDGQHSVFPFVCLFVCLLQILKRNPALAAMSQLCDVGILSMGARSRPMALRKLSRGTTVWVRGSGARGQDGRKRFER